MAEQRSGGLGCFGVIVVVLLTLWVLGFFNPTPRPPDHPTQVGSVGGGPGAAVAGGWHR